MKTIKLFILLIALGILSSCNDAKKSTANQDAKKENVSNKEIKTLPFKIVEFNKGVLKKLKDVQGDFLYGKRWQDANGDNVLVFTLKQTFKKWEDAEEPDMGNYTRYLKVYHFKSKDEKKYELVRLIQDFNQNPCGSPPFLLEGDFFKESITISDVDNDNFGEATFMYYFNCASEVNPRTVKLMLLENGEKYAIRGDEYIKEFYPNSGKKEFGKEFNSAPKEFRSHASKIWEKSCKSNPNL